MIRDIFVSAQTGLAYIYSRKQAQLVSEKRIKAFKHRSLKRHRGPKRDGTTRLALTT